MAVKGPDRWSMGLPQLRSASGGMQAIGGLFAMAADAVRFVFVRPFQLREFIEQSWFVARVSLAPTLLVAIPFTVLVSFTLNILLRELGAADLSGAGAAFGAVTQVGPLVTVLIVPAAFSLSIAVERWVGPRLSKRLLTYRPGDDGQPVIEGVGPDRPQLGRGPGQIGHRPSDAPAE